MSIGVLGPLTVDGDTAATSPRDRVILAALVAYRGEAVSSETLADALWGERPPPSAGKVVQGCVARLRKTLGASTIETVPHGYRLALTNDNLDAARFEQQVARGQELLSLGEADRAAYVLDEALDLWRGKALTDLDGWEPGRIEAARLEELRQDAEELQLEARLRAGRFREVLAEAQSHAAAAPLRERRWALLALAQYQSGRQADALRTIRRARRMLADELGLDVGPELAELEGAILRQDASLVAAAALPEQSVTSPYLGLVPYGIADADEFFGRDSDVAECLRRLADDGVLVVVGPSGSGKSSLVRAGVAAALERDGRRVAVVTPGARPMDMFSALPRPGRTPVLVVDQCEEAVTLCQDTDEQARFFTALAAHADGGPLVVALRADRLGEMSAHPAFARLIERGIYLVRRMDEGDLRAAIEGPAQQAGLLLEPGLVDLLVRDVEGEPGALPLLSHALRQTWERREGRTLTVAGYQASGGIRGAVAQSAEQVYEQAPPEQRAILRGLLLRLVTPSPEGDPVRSRVARRAVATDPEHEQIIEQLVRARLVTSDQDVVELAHEALARAWPRLRSWLDDDIEGQRIWRHVATTADAWDAMDRPESELYRGVRLARAVEWREQGNPDLNPVEQAFLDASQRSADAERRAAEEQARRQVRVNRRLRVLVAGVAALAVVAATGGVAALRQAQRADAEADIARSHELAASAISVLDEDPSLAKLLAVASATVAEPTLESTSALHRAWAADLATSRYGVTFDAGLMWTDLHPSGELMVASGTFPVGGSGGTIEVVDPSTDERLWSVDFQDDADHASAFVGSPFFAADGEHLVAGAFWDPLNLRRLPFDGVDEPPPDLVGAYVWNARTGELVEQFDLGRCGGLVVGASNTHLLVKTLHGPPEVLDECAWADGTMGAELIDRHTGSRELLSADVGAWLWGAAMSGDGRYVTYDDTTASGIVVLDIASGERVHHIDGQGVRDLSPDGSLLLSGDEPMEVWNVATGELVSSFDGHAGQSLFAGFGPSGRTVYSTGADGALREWDATTGRELFAYPGVGNGRPSFTDGGLILVGLPDRETATLLDTRLRGEVGVVETCPGSAPSDSLTVVNGTAVFDLYCGDDPYGTTHVVDVSGGEVLLTVPGHQAQTLDVSPDGSRFVRQDGEGSVHGPLVVRDARTGDEIVTLGGLCTWDAALPGTPGEQAGCLEYPAEPFGIWAWRLRWSPDGTMIAVAFDNRLAVWDATTGDLLHTEDADPNRSDTVDLVFSADSARLAVTNAAWLIRTLATDTWETITERELFADGAYQMGLAGYTPDGSTLLAVGAFRANTAGALHWFDPESMDITRSKINVHQGSIRSVAMHPDGSRLATGGSDGLVRVWDVATGDLVHEVPFGNVSVQGVAFVGDSQIAVALADGNLMLATTDPDELLDIVRASLTRGFTLPECARFNFGDGCPTLAELGDLRPGADTDALAGSFQVTWTPDDLAGHIAASAAEFVGAELDGDFTDGLSDITAEAAGVYTLTFSDSGRFDVTHDRMDETYCTGTYAVRDDRLWMSSERGWCIEIKWFDAAFEVTDDELRFAADDFRGIWPYNHIFAGRPLARLS